MSSEEVRRIEKKIDERADSIQRTLQDTINQVAKRVGDLELKEARREGKESVVVSANFNWQKIAMSLAQSLGYGLGAAYLIAQWLLK